MRTQPLRVRRVAQVLRFSAQFAQGRLYVTALALHGKMAGCDCRRRTIADASLGLMFRPFGVGSANMAMGLVGITCDFVESGMGQYRQVACW